jgi:anti-sigma factor RsiW
MTLPANIDFDNLKPEEFEHILPDLFASGDGKVSQDPRLKRFLAANPDCAALVYDLEIIAETARSLFEPVADPSDRVWQNIQARLQEDSALASIDDDYIDPAPPID